MAVENNSANAVKMFYHPEYTNYEHPSNGLHALVNLNGHYCFLDFCFQCNCANTSCRVLYPSRRVQPFADICLSESTIKEFLSETWSKGRSTTNLMFSSIIFALLLITAVSEANVWEGLHCPGRVKHSISQMNFSSVKELGEQGL